VDNRYGKTFVKHRNSLGIEVIENEPYSPEQNGKIKRFHKTLKREFFYRHRSYTDSLETLNYKYSQWLTYHNHQRRHVGLGMNGLTPAQKIASTLLKVTANTLILTNPQKATGTPQEYKSWRRGCPVILLLEFSLGWAGRPKGYAGKTLPIIGAIKGVLDER